MISSPCLFVLTLLCIFRSTSGFAIPGFDKSDLVNDPSAGTAPLGFRNDIDIHERRNGGSFTELPKDATPFRPAKRTDAQGLVKAFTDVETAFDAGGSTDLRIVATTLSGIDARFHMNGRMGQPQGNALSFYMNAIAALAQLSHLPFGDIMAPESFSFRGYGDVVISVTGQPRGQPLLRKYVVWALVLALADMVMQGSFALAAYELFWVGAQVGTMIFQPEAENIRAEKRNGIVEPSGGSLSPPSNYSEWDYIDADFALVNDTSLDALTKPPRQWDIWYNFIEDKPLTTARFFLPIIAVIGAIAQDDLPDQNVRGFRSDPLPVPANGSYLFVNDYDGPRARAPFFTYSKAVGALVRIAGLGAKRVRESRQQEVPLRELQAVLELGLPGRRTPVGHFWIEQQSSVVSPAVS